MIVLTHDNDAVFGAQERCCFCRKPTSYWFAPKDVAVCQECAKYATANDVPAKAEWCRRERIAMAKARRFT